MQKKRITLFRSLEEMNQADAKEMARLAPAVHLINTTYLIKKIFADKVKQPMNKSIKWVEK